MGDRRRRVVLVWEVGIWGRKACVCVCVSPCVVIATNTTTTTAVSTTITIMFIVLVGAAAERVFFFSQVLTYSAVLITYSELLRGVGDVTEIVYMFALKSCLFAQKCFRTFSLVHVFGIYERELYIF